ncbi:MAG: RNB domain-containing ribonuclease [Treponema sp.]|nr:RNB domain-containing ribonuclease [Treponema sp.]
MLKPALSCLVWYKGRPALVTELGFSDRDEKITISTGAGKETIKVRGKDIEILHPGPLQNLAGLVSQINQIRETGDTGDLLGAWELIESGGVPVSLRELAELAYGEFTAQSALTARLLLEDGLYFTGTVDAVTARSAAEIKIMEEKRQGKAKEDRDREAFLERLRTRALDLPSDGRFLQDVEALAYGKTTRSRTMKDLGLTETPQEAHRLLLECGFWNKWLNPYPRRFGLSHGTLDLSFDKETIHKNTISMEMFPLERRDLSHLPAFAVDSSWSKDPDDALSLENENGRRILYVHVADPALVVKSGSPADRFACARGATLYLPEGPWLMLNEDALSCFALGLKDEPNRALTFKLTINSNGTIENTEIFPSIVNVTRLSYEKADKLIEDADMLRGTDNSAAVVLKELVTLSDANLERRLDAGAVNILLPEVHISVFNHRVEIQPIVSYRSADMVRECMLLAGEGAASWAAKRGIAFPFIHQEAGDLPAKPLTGLAGSCQLRRCMRPRSVSVKPGYHWGLGLDSYSQVTSPLRRYTDLLAHQQIYAWFCKEAGKSADGTELLNEEEMLLRLAVGDAAIQAAIQAERASKAHWTAVYLDELLSSDTADGVLWDAVITEKRANGLGVIIPAIGLETQCAGTGDLNNTIRVHLKSVRIPELEMKFVCD